MDNSRYYEEDFNGFVDQLIQSDHLDDKQCGIAKLYLDKGYDVLSKKQKYVFDKAIEDNSVDSCKRCGINIPWCEMFEALDNGGFCGYCQHMMEKDE